MLLYEELLLTALSLPFLRRSGQEELLEHPVSAALSSNRVGNAETEAFASAFASALLLPLLGSQMGSRVAQTLCSPCARDGQKILLKDK